MRVLSVDPGKRCTGYYVWHGRGEHSESLRQERWLNPYSHLPRIRQRTMELVSVYRPGFALVEDYPWRREATVTAYAIECGGVVREALTCLRVPVVVMPIATWRSVTIGTRTARVLKDDTAYLAEVERRFGRAFATTDEADAFMMYEAALRIWRGEVKTDAALRLRTEIEKAVAAARTSVDFLERRKL